jgi:hypothetical protein
MQHRREVVGGAGQGETSAPRDDCAARPYACPVCGGRGIVPPGFYWPSSGMGTVAVPEPCRACDGIGVVWR